MEKQEVERITVPDGGERLDVFLARHFDGVHTRSRISSLIKSADVMLNGRTVKAGTIIKSGDVIEITDAGCVYSEDTAEDIALDVVYEDEYLAVINKPRGLVVHPGAGNPKGTLLNALLGRLRDTKAAEVPDRAGIVHRLDKNTAGLIVAAKTAAVQAKLASMFERREVKRIYLGLVEGIMTGSGTIDANIKRNERQRTLYTCMLKPDEKKGRRAVTHYRVIKNFDRGVRKYSLVEFELETGRTHQIRVHCKTVGHPIVGDPEYNPKSSVKTGGQLLESVKIEFSHPVTGHPVKQEIGPSNTFLNVLANFG